MKKLIFVFYFLMAVSAKNFGQSDINISNLASFDGEPSIAINPTNSNNIIAGWMRLKLDGKIWIATKASFDGGLSWSAINYLPHDTVINGSADVSIAFHNSGVAYLSYINFRTSPDTAGAVFLSKSSDGGLSWSAPNKIIDITDKPDLPIDRPWISIDNSGGINDGTVYFTSMSAFWYTGQHHIYLRSTPDGGASWSNIKQVDDSLYSVGSIKVSYAPISVGGDGKLYITYLSYNTVVSPFVRLYAATTTDAGNTFQRFVVSNIFASYSKLPFYTISADPLNTGHVIVSWCDIRFNDLDILLSKSIDGGQTWTNPLRINDDTVNNGIVQDQVWSAFSVTGELALAWRDRRLNDTTSTSSFDIYASVSLDGGDSFQPNFRLSSISSPYSLLTCCNSFIGLALTDSVIVADWGDYRNMNWDIYFNRTNIPTTGIKENVFDGNFNLQIFPNPFSEITILEIANVKNQNYELKIYDLFGREVRLCEIKNQKTEISKDDLPSGMYFYQLKDNKQFISSGKLIVQ